VIGTAGTIGSGAYDRAIRRLAPNAEVVTRACPLFVPLVEEGWFDHPATRLVAEEYLAPLRARGVGTLVLGCTHYPLLKGLLAEVMGAGVALIDSAEETASAVARALGEQELEAPPGNMPEHRFAVSDDPERFLSVGARFLGERLATAEVVTLGTA
jgi:glutamate racemase